MMMKAAALARKEGLHYNKTTSSEGPDRTWGKFLGGENTRAW